MSATLARGSTAAHTVKAVKGEHLPGSWAGACSCGWRGDVQGFKGARSRALSEAYAHEYRAELDAAGRNR